MEFKVGQLLVCGDDTLGVIQGVYKRERGRCYYLIEFSDDNINNNYPNAYWEQHDVETWYWNYVDIKAQQ